MRNKKKQQAPIGNTVENLVWVNSPEAEKVVAESKIAREYTSPTIDKFMARSNPERHKKVEKKMVADTLGEVTKNLIDANQLLKELYQAILTDTDPQVVIMKMGVYLGKHHII